MYLFKLLRFVYYIIHCSLARNSLVIWSDVTEDQFLYYVLASCLIFKKRKEKKCLIVLCQMIATCSPNLLLPVVFLLSEHWYLPALEPRGTCSFRCSACSLHLGAGRPPTPGAPVTSCFSWVKFTEHHYLPFFLAWTPSQIFLRNFFSNASPQEVSYHIRKIGTGTILGLQIK